MLDQTHDLPTVIDIGPADAGAPPAATLINNGRVRVLRLAVAAEKTLPAHTAPGPLVIQCLAGRVAISALDADFELHPQQLLYLPAGAVHSVTGIEDAVLLLTIIRDAAMLFDPVDEAGEESFPASDPPARSPLTRP